MSNCLFVWSSNRCSFRLFTHLLRHEQIYKSCCFLHVFFHAGSFLQFVVFLKIRRQEVHWKPKVWKPNVTQKISLTANPSDWFSWKQINLDNNGIRSHRFHSAESRACVPLTSQADILDAVQLIHYAFEFCLQSSFQSRLIPKKICLLLLRHQKNQVSNYFNQQKQTKKNCNCTARTCGMQSEATFQATRFLCRSCRLYLHLINSYEK